MLNFKLGRLMASCLVLALLPPTPASTLAEVTVSANPDDAAALMDAPSLRHSLGRKTGDPGFNPAADLNNDGVVNVLDAAIFQKNNLHGEDTSDPAHPNAVEHTAATQGSEQIVVQLQTTVVTPGTTPSILFLIRNNSTPLLGYSLDVDFAPFGSVQGSVTANIASTNFYDVRNLFTAGGKTRDPLFSVILDGSDGGVFVNTITSDDSTVLAVDGVNDALAQVVLNTSADACGIWEIKLGQATALSDANGSPVTYNFASGFVIVTDGVTCTAPTSIPAVSEWGEAILILLLLAAGTIVVRSRTSPSAEGVSATCQFDEGFGQ
ncbi:MAG: hypothetical protein HY287_03600 [Planctomycetes bacterium]|nr:hypothetical protein [Planctomycetota bacterium]MBI3833396.1 hypothetical protein [Planctomycetota bacterium]